MGKVEQFLRISKPSENRKSVSVSDLAQLEPLTTIGDDVLDGLAQVSQWVEQPKSTAIFSKGDIDPRVLYLRQGQIRVTFPDGRSEILDSSDQRSLSPITTEKQRPYRAEAVTDVLLLAIPTSAWDQVLATTPASADGYEVDEIPTADGATWIHNFLKSPVFLRLPAGNIQAILSKFEEVPVAPGQLILKQGSQANNYYVVKEGRLKVSRRPESSDCTIELATLSSGDGFGEEAIISQGLRNACVTALSAGALMRLGKQDFIDLLMAPLIRRVTIEQAQLEVQKGGVFFDVRSTEEFRRDGLRHGLNIPLSLLRANISQLDSRTKHVVYCNNGLISAAAAFVLWQHGKKAVVLDGGLQNIVAAAPSRRRTTPAEKVLKTNTSENLSPPLLVQVAKPALKSQRNDKQARLEAEKTLADLKSKVDSLEKKMETSGASDELATVEDIICVDRDEALLWTPIPGTSDLSVNQLKHSGEAAIAKSPAKRDIVCVGESDAIFWEPIVTPRVKTVSSETVAAPLSSHDAEPKVTTKQNTQQGWISDHYLWETVLGYTADPEVDSLLAQEETKARAVQPPTKPEKPAQKKKNVGSGKIHSAKTARDGRAKAAPKATGKLDGYVAHKPWWLHTLYGVITCAAVASSYLVFFPNQPLSAGIVAMTTQSAEPMPKVINKTDPVPRTPAAEKNVDKAKPAIKRQPESKPVAAVPPNPTVTIGATTVIGLTSPAEAPFDSFVVPTNADIALEKNVSVSFNATQDASSTAVGAKAPLTNFERENFESELNNEAVFLDGTRSASPIQK